MIQGNVVGLQARIGVILRLPGNLDIEIECVVDTGFEGFLTLPSAVITELGLLYIARSSSQVMVVEMGTTEA